MTKKTITSLVGVIILFVAAALAGGSGAEVPNTGSNDWDWSSAGYLSQGRISHAATVLADGKSVLVVGGAGMVKETLKTLILDTAELYNGKRWVGSTKFNQAREYLTATLLPNGKVLAAGGRTVDPNPFTILDPYTPFKIIDLASCSIYDPTKGTWADTNPLTDARCLHTATVLTTGPNAGQVLVTGGAQTISGGLLSKILTSCELYDPDKGTWTKVKDLNVGRMCHTATVLADGQVLVTGGFDSAYKPLTSCELYDPETDSWNSDIPEFHDARGWHTATLLPNGWVLAAGGATDFSSGYGTIIRKSCEIYVPDSTRQYWNNNVAELNIPRCQHAATVLTQDPYKGQVLVVGGPTSQQSGEIFTPPTTPLEIGAWNLTPHLIKSPGHSNPTATILKTGYVLVVGGFVQEDYPKIGPINRTTLFQPPPSPQFAMPAKK